MSKGLDDAIRPIPLLVIGAEVAFVVEGEAALLAYYPNLFLDLFLFHQNRNWDNWWRRELLDNFLLNYSRLCWDYLLLDHFYWLWYWGYACSNLFGNLSLCRENLWVGCRFFNDCRLFSCSYGRDWGNNWGHNWINHWSLHFDQPNIVEGLPSTEHPGNQQTKRKNAS